MENIFSENIKHIDILNGFFTSDIENIKILLNKSNNGKKTFRYFNKRSYDIINNHIVSEIYFIDNEPVGYYHIEKENNYFWFGIIISDSYIGKGISNIIMERAIKKSNNLNIDLFLSVDKSNKIAFNLYRKNNFFILNENESYYIMKRNKD